MPKYPVKSSITHNHQEYLAGSVIELTEDQAKSMPWAVGEALPEELPPPPLPPKKVAPPKKGE